MPLRVLVYAALYWEREWKAWAAQKPRPEGFRLTPILPVVFHSGPTPWRTPRTLAELLGGPEEVKAHAPRCEPLFWDLAEQDRSALLTGPSDWLAALAVVQAEAEPDAETFRSVFATVLGRLEKLGRRTPVRWHDLLQFVLAWGLRRRPRVEAEALQQVAVSSHRTVTRQREIERMSQSVLKSRDQEVYEEAQVDHAREWLRMLLEDRFGALPPGIIEQIESTSEMERLHAAARQAWRMDSLSDLHL